MSGNNLLFEVGEGVAWIGFNRPESRNAMTWDMYDALEKVCERLADDDGVHAVVLHGVGGEAFVAQVRNHVNVLGLLHGAVQKVSYQH